MKLNSLASRIEFGEPEERLSPERALMAGILESAFIDLEGRSWISGDSDGDGVERRKEAAQRWIRSDDVYCCPQRGISFVFVCEVLTLDFQEVRKKLSQ